MGSSRRIITLTTDFGLKDPYAGAMKGVILSINPGASIVDITHGITPGNIMEGALAMLDACRFFPAGTVHVGVVDPGVGGPRRAVLVETERYLFVGPDNGLLSPALQSERIKGITHLTNKEYFLEAISATFHGRDIFAPVAAHLSLGTVPADLGPPLDGLLELELPRPELKEGVLYGKIIHIDSFGNLITNIKERDLLEDLKTKDVKIDLKGFSINGIAASYCSVGTGELTAIVGSSGRVEVAAFGARASDILGASVGDSLRILAR